MTIFEITDEDGKFITYFKDKPAANRAIERSARYGRTRHITKKKISKYDLKKYLEERMKT